ncbi:NAD(P)/FAD-dependent oxidoreductase [Muriicola soli]|uniref:FAD-binding oxidoreductase n=1 Tax=Muriicola soli TaxID=2507538 RepID=A0A411ECZ3_9FLAO|nr:FAD-dependent oxidoreductase [Muriicola soli]QBA65290.1 FAD-binding oxidoreductase [Muriicola soli]
MNLSHWEYSTWFKGIDYTIVGSGIVGLSCALELRRKYPKAKIVVLERGILPRGASTKNAGFACFGSISEILYDLEQHSPEEVLALVKKRFEGIELLRSALGDRALNFHQWGGHELFLDKDKELFEQCKAKLELVNDLLSPVFKSPAFVLQPNTFGFSRVGPHYITNPFEGQIDTGLMMAAMQAKVQASGIQIFNAMEVLNHEEDAHGISVRTKDLDFRTEKLIVATNGFAAKWLESDLQPARAQVLITKPIPDLQIQGTFHFDKGYYYFRNVEDRILFGGGRNLNFRGEETEELGLTDLIQNELERLLHEVILPETSFEIDRRWSGIMGVGSKKKPIVKRQSDRVFYGVRLGGMGIAIGSSVGRDLAQLV